MTTLIQHHIDAQGATPIKRVSLAVLQALQDSVRKMLREGVIERSTSAWSSAPVMAKKVNGELRFCINYRDVNEDIKKETYPIPNMDAISDKLISYQKST